MPLDDLADGSIFWMQPEVRQWLAAASIEYDAARAAYAVLLAHGNDDGAFEDEAKKRLMAADSDLFDAIREFVHVVAQDMDGDTLKDLLQPIRYPAA